MRALAKMLVCQRVASTIDRNSSVDEMLASMAKRYGWDESDVAEIKPVFLAGFDSLTKDAGAKKAFYKHLVLYKKGDVKCTVTILRFQMIWNNYPIWYSILPIPI